MAETEYTVGEGDGMVSVCMELEQGTLNDETITVDFSVSADSASSSKADPTSVPVKLISAIVSLTATLYLLSLSLSPGDFGVSETVSVSLGPMAATGSTQCLTISITDDNIVESIESFSVAMISASDSVTLGYPRTASVDITDNDGIFSLLQQLHRISTCFYSTDVTVLMVDAVYTVGESSGVVSVCVQLQGEMEGMSATVQLSTQSGTASESGERLHCQQQLTLFPSLLPN